MQRGEEMSRNYDPQRGSLGENLRRFRKENGYTHKYLAEYLKVERSTYSKYETSRTPDLDNTIRLAALYGVSLDMLVGDYFDEIANKKNPSTFVKASSSEPNESSDLTHEELKLLALFRKSIRKKDIIDYVRVISSEDNENID